MSRHATPEGTKRYAERFPEAAGNGHFRPAAGGLTISSIGLGTYLGEADADCDARYTQSAMRCLDLGVNVLDTAANYRHQRSECSIGAALKAKLGGGSLKRDEILVCTKGGYLSFNGDTPADPAVYFRERFVETGVLDPAKDVVAGCHSMTPRYLEDQVETSLRNLGLDCADVYYVHNPETQLPHVGPEEFYRRLQAAFETLEALAAKGKLLYYGTATWNGYRVPPSSPEHLSLERVLACAEAAGGKSHRFRFVQCPVNLAMLEAAASPTQSLKGKAMPLLEAAAALDVTVISSASLLQGRMARSLPQEFRRLLPDFSTDAQRALHVTRSIPGLTAALVGMSRPAHVEENLALVPMPPLPRGKFENMFGGTE